MGKVPYQVNIQVFDRCSFKMQSFNRRIHRLSMVRCTSTIDGGKFIRFPFLSVVAFDAWPCRLLLRHLPHIRECKSSILLGPHLTCINRKTNMTKQKFYTKTYICHHFVLFLVRFVFVVFIHPPRNSPPFVIPSSRRFWKKNREPQGLNRPNRYILIQSRES